MKNIKQDPKPSWYEIGLSEPTVLRFKLHKSALSEINKKTNWTHPNSIIADIVKRFKFSIFTPPSENTWGFENVCIFHESTDPNWLEWKIQLRSRDERHNLAVRSTLYLIRTVMKNVDIETNSQKMQLMVIDAICLPMTERVADLSVILTPTTAWWISKQSHNQFLTVVEAIASAYCFMCDSPITLDGFYISATGRLLYLNMPSSHTGCWLNPSGNCGTDRNGYVLDSHNTDNSVEQLSWIIGMAKLHDLIRADGY